MGQQRSRDKDHADMIRDDATQRQVDAANPGQSTWLAANAGSGKTRVLTDRVARLLLEDVSPQNILCLTYTKAAAAEMQNRLFKRLGGWAMMPDDALRADLRQLGVDRAIDADRLRAARTLFARAIETPGGLKIQTIHSFCASILRRFPLEAGVSPQFREMEDRAAELLRAEVVDQLLTDGHAQAVQNMLACFTGDNLAGLTASVTRHKDAFLRPVDRAALCRLLDIDPHLTAENLLARVLDDTAIAAVRRLQAVCATGSTNDQKAANRLRAFCPDGQPRLADLQILEGLLLFGENAKTPFGPKIDQFPTKGLRSANPELMDDINPLMELVAEARQDRMALAVLDRTLALYAFGRAFAPAYEARKLVMGALDFDDLISKARALLTDTAVAQWVLFRLDGGIDHVLVDEAQDTSPAQWDVIETLTQEFATGLGASTNRERTVFVVGDKKQSIYSFQGADPAAFDRMQAHFKTAHDAIGKRFEVTSLDHSFRSSQAILSAVDATFTGDQAAGMGTGISHIAFKDQMPGRVDLWPVIEKTKTEDDRPWYDPVDLPGSDDHNVLMAQRIAAQIKAMIAHDTIPVEDGHSGRFNRRPITPGDFLILVQRRSDLFAEIIRACKAANLDIAGADRLRVGAELAVKDLGALLSFLALPEDDLSLAAALRSPLFDLSEQDLFTLAHHRQDQQYLWQALRASDHHDVMQVLDDLRKNADFLRPYDLIARILTRHDGRRKLLARLGPEAEDGIDALLAQALAYEQTGVPSLTGFLSWMQTDALEVKRQMDSQGDKIRVMTVHGAKGLEAPIVILPETQKRPNVIRADILAAGDQVIWKPTANAAPDSVLALQDHVLARQAEERLRLLYVAMTRAEKWLIIGAAGDVGDDMDSWYNIAAAGLRARGAVLADAHGLAVERLSHLDWDALPLVHQDKPAPDKVNVPVFGPLPELPVTTRLSPSELPGPKVLPGDTLEGDEDAMERGTMIHLLLEHLPLVAPQDRAAHAAALIPLADPALIADVARLLDQPELGHLWADDALAEVPITADLLGLGRIHGTIDRLIVTGDRVLAVDYKTNRQVPDQATQTPLGVLRQQAAYRAALMQVFPGRQIDVAILWTANGQLMTLPDDLLAKVGDDLASLDLSRLPT
jgi:ATP-dependent helicase/nuclease subunit A